MNVVNMHFQMVMKIQKQNKIRGFELVKGYDGKLLVIANVGDGGADFYTAERVVLRPVTINTLILIADNKNMIKIKKAKNLFVFSFKIILEYQVKENTSFHYEYYIIDRRKMISEITLIIFLISNV